MRKKIKLKKQRVLALVLSLWVEHSGLNYKPMMIVNDDSWVVKKLEASLTDDARVVIYDRHMFIVQAAGLIILQTRVQIPLLPLGERKWRKTTNCISYYSNL